MDLILYYDFDLWPHDLQRLQCIGCHVTKPCTRRQALRLSLGHNHHNLPPKFKDRSRDLGYAPST